MTGIIEDDITTIPGNGEIIPPESESAALFVPNGLDKIIEEVRKRVEQHQHDITTEKGRKAIASLARWVSNQKSTVEEYGKNKSMAIKRQATDIDAERKRGKEAFDALRDKARKPLTDYEEALAVRLEAHEAALREVAELSNPPFGADAAEIERRIAKLDDFSLRNWEEFSERFGMANEAVGVKLGRILAETKKAEEDRLTLKKLEEERTARESEEAKARQAQEQSERDERIAREATEKAERASQEREAQARRDTEAAEARASKAEQDIKDAAERAEQEKAAAVESERKRVEDALLAEEATTASREKDKTHKSGIHNQAMSALVTEAGVTTDMAKSIVTVIAQGKIPNVKVMY